LTIYNADATRRSAARPNFDPARFVDSCDTIYVTAPSPQAGAERTARRRAARADSSRDVCAGRRRRASVFLCLDEVANIAPIHDLPALVSEAGGQGLHVLACLQDLSQARQRWGDAAADGFLSLFQTKLILSGIADSRTLEAISLALGEYDRRRVSYTTGRSQAEKLLPPPGSMSESVTYQTQRQRTLPCGDIAQLPNGHALLLRGVRWGLLLGIGAGHALTRKPSIWRVFLHSGGGIPTRDLRVMSHHWQWR
jgi:type IV secretory pathway TraG/TraD family ATPase VirD4